MNKEIAIVVWSYRAVPFHRIVCFRLGSIVYNGGWLSCSDSVWIVPGTIRDEERC